MSKSIRNVRTSLVSLRGRVEQHQGDWASAAQQYQSAASLNPADGELWYKAGNAYFRSENYGLAESLLSKAVTADPKNRDWWYRLGFTQERLKEFEKALDSYAHYIQLGGEKGRGSYRQGRCYLALAQNDLARERFTLSASMGHERKKSYEALAQMEEKKTPLWQRLALRREGQSDFDGSDRWTLDHARFAFFMNEAEEAVQYYSLSDESTKLANGDKINYAKALEQLGEYEPAQELLKQVLSTKSKSEQIFGIGAVFHGLGEWDRARREYMSALDHRPNNPDLLYRIAYCYDRQYMWSEARAYFERAIRISPTNAYWKYKCAHSCERMGDREAAIGWYLEALELDPTKSYWWYRIAVVLSSGESRGSELKFALLKSLGVSPDTVETDPGDSDQRLMPAEFEATRQKVIEHEIDSAVSREGGVSGDAANTLHWARVALERGRCRDGLELVRRALVTLPEITNSERAQIVADLFESSEKDLAIQTALNARKFRLQDGVDVDKYMKSDSARINRTYAEYMSTRPIDSRTVLFESNHGASAGCHPLALFREMMTDQRFEDCVFVWAVNDAENVPEDVRMFPRIQLIKLHSDAYLYHLATAKYLINNVSFPPYFVRRPEQKYLNTWHGTPMKTLGRSMKQGIVEYENLERNFIQATHLMAPNELTRWALVDEHNLGGILTAKVGLVGSPRLDRLVNDTGEMRAAIRARLGVGTDERFVLVAPTWRGGVSDRDLDGEALRDELSSLAEIPGVRVFYRAHRLTEKLVRGMTLPVGVVPQDIDTNDLLSAVDHLVSDYSSISFDFLPTGRPVTLYVPDEEEYSEDRGLYLRPEELPFDVARDVAELVASVGRSAIADPEAYAVAQQLYAPFEDGGASRRCVDFLMEEFDEAVPASGQKTYLFHASLIPNGIASSLLAILAELVKRNENVVLLVEPKVIRQDPGRAEILARVPDGVKLVSRVGGLVLTPEESYVRSGIESRRFVPGSDMRDIYRRIWARECRRILGDMRIDHAIEWDGYAVLWSNMIVRSGQAGQTLHSIWQHNDMKQELDQKFPELANVFDSYSEFDRIVSVSGDLGEVNESFMRAELPRQTEPVQVVHNLVPWREIVQKAEEEVPPEIQEFFDAHDQVVVTIGRMSPEKNQKTLLEAWRDVVARHPDAGLILIGSGPLSSEVEAAVIELGLSSTVLLTGQIPNPLPVLRRANLFVLPSLHEGQPVVLFEAMSLGTPLLATDLPGNVEAMREGYGEILPLAVEDMSARISAELDAHPQRREPVNFDQYNKRCISEFLSLSRDQ